MKSRFTPGLLAFLFWSGSPWALDSSLAQSKLSTSEIVVRVEKTKVCGQEFSTFSLDTQLADVFLAQTQIAVEGLALEAGLPLTVVSRDPNLKPTVSIRGNIEAPPLPIMPILPEGLEKDLCGMVKDYSRNYASKKQEILRKYDSQVFSLSAKSTSLSLSLKSGYAEVIQKAAQRTSSENEKLKETIKTREQKKNQKLLEQPATSNHIHDFVIVYEPAYQTDVLKIKNFYDQRGIRTIAISVQNLPGYNVNAPEPADCSGDFLHECYHFWGDPAPGVSQLAVPSLPGYVPNQSAFVPYTKVAFIPGLIRAYLRLKKRENPALKGALLIGSADRMPPYHTNIKAHYFSFPNPVTGFPQMKVFTDVYYSLADVPLIQVTTALAHQIRSPDMWSCNGPQGIRLDYWCNQNEGRHWPTPALTAYRNAPHIPDGKIFNLKYGFLDPYWLGFNYSDVIPVGRLVTPKASQPISPVVSDYADKLVRWHQELPTLLNRSISSTGGSTSDSWIYLKDDIDQFQNTFGTSTKVYASEFFVGSTKCAGRCTYQQSPYIMDEIGQQNIPALHLNGHGGHRAVQGPYGNGNVSSTYLTEKSVGMEGNLRLEQYVDPTSQTLLKVEQHSKLIGIVFANSCSPSNFLNKNHFLRLSKSVFPDSVERSWAEEWIAMKNAGAMNTFLNGDVGWGNSDNLYNVAFMGHLKTAWLNCGNIGDAMRLQILNGLRYGGNALIGSWQLFNRNFLGSPLNPIAKLPSSCITVVDSDHMIDKK